MDWLDALSLRAGFKSGGTNAPIRHAPLRHVPLRHAPLRYAYGTRLDGSGEECDTLGGEEPHLATPDITD